MLRTAAVNVILRGLTLAAKFLLLLAIARYLTPSELGVYGIMTATIALSLFFLGLDFYAFSTREILSKPENTWPAMIRDQFLFHTLVYLVVLPLLTSVFLIELLPWRYLGYFYLILVLEHLSQESFRLLVTLSRSSMANAVLFLRGGAWVLAVGSIWFYLDTGKGLEMIWIGWSVGLVGSLILSYFALRKMNWRSAFSQPVDRVWIKKGLRICLPFFVATVAMTSIQYIDRYYIQYHLGDAMVGVYTFFFSISNVVYVFVFTAVMMILQPRIVKAYRKGEMREYRKHMRTLILGTISSAVLLAGMAAIGIKPILEIIGKPIYSDNLSVFWILLAAATVLTCSHIPHYALYARMHDRAIVICSLLAFVTALGACTYLVPRFGLQGAAFATLAASSVLGLSRLLFLFKIGTSDRSPMTEGARSGEIDEAIL